jgi:hypothetical protein
LAHFSSLPSWKIKENLRTSAMSLFSILYSNYLSKSCIHQIALASFLPQKFGFRHFVITDFTNLKLGWTPMA